MVLTNESALSLIMNPAIVQAVPELAVTHEEFKTEERRVLADPNCTRCNKKDPLAKLRPRAVGAIVGLSADGMTKLKAFLNEQNLYAYVARPGQPDEFKKL